MTPPAPAPGAPPRRARPAVAVLDYGGGNLSSVAAALGRSGLEAVVTDDPAAVARAHAVVLPGVGAFRHAAQSLRAAGLDDALRRSLDAGRPYLGICLGLQLLFEQSDEHGTTPGLGWLPGRVEHFTAGHTAAPFPHRVPHIGWNRVDFCGDHPMLRALPEDGIYYFVHAHRALPADPSLTLGATDYGGSFAAAVGRGSIFAVQFHPEKSQWAGKCVFDAFARWIASS